MSEDAVRELHRLATAGRGERIRLDAAVALLYRALGKPKVSIEGDGSPMNFTAIRQIIVSPDGQENIIPAIFGDEIDRNIEDPEVVE